MTKSEDQDDKQDAWFLFFELGIFFSWMTSLTLDDVVLKVNVDTDVGISNDTCDKQETVNFDNKETE